MPLGSPLSPRMGACFLTALEAALAALGRFSVRDMDDILVLAPTRWTLRAAVKVVNPILASLHLAKHPDNTVIGRVPKGVDFLGYHVRPGRLLVATKTLEHCVARACRLDEQEPGAGSCSRLGIDVRRGVRWVSAGVAAGTPAVTCPPGVGTRARALPPR
jgi:RNA-directed DNA polymerase